ncbi:aminopeptidase P family protein [Peptostreptococcaceae bacterium AGR-M142]
MTTKTDLTVKQRVDALKNIMIENNIDAYIIPSADYHASEYVGEHFKSREFISGFTGSAGTVVITKDKCGLWTDGRYFIQAEKELKDSSIDLYKMGEENVLTYEEFLEENLDPKDVLGFYGKTVSTKKGLEFESKFKNIVYNMDLINEIWTDRPALPNKNAFLHDEKYAGLSTSKKLEQIRIVLEKEKVNSHILSTLDDIAWIYNIRGNDVSYNPVSLAYSYINNSEAILFIDLNKVDDDIKNYLNENNVQIKDYIEFDTFIKDLKDKSILIDSTKVNYFISKNLNSDIKIHDGQNPSTLLKACKNEIEIKNAINSHIKDGVAFTKFMKYLKENITKKEMTELSAEEKLEEYRKEQDLFVEPSFKTISAYKENAALMHYSATKDSHKKLEAKDLYLVDSGGQYLDGSTDITRTIALGEITKEQRTHFTLVLKGMLNLSMAKFLYGVTGTNLDILARKPMWDNAIDYKCGTGHGVGFFLNIHEGPHGIRWQYNSQKLEENMVVTNEPGIYVENSHGIRIENELVVKKDMKNEFGQFMKFDVLTLAPIDLDALDESMLTVEEKTYLNNYHQKVYDKVSIHLNDDEKSWLKNYTRKI